MADNRVVKVTLRAQIAEYKKGMQEAAQATETAAQKSRRELGELEDQLQEVEAASQMVGRALVVAGTAMLGATAMAVKAAAEWESAWAGVTKTVDGTPQQLSELEQGLRDLTGVLPASHEEIAGVAEAAGQLGIQTDNVTAFTKTMIDLGETTNLSANDAATSLARFTNIMGTSQADVSRLGSALVGLGNNYATTEAEIMAMSMRLAGAGRQIGLSEGDVMGLATALSSVGIEAEAGGSAISKVMIDIAASVEEGGDRLGKFAAVAGMSADGFATKWKTEPAEALAAFVKGLSNAEAQGSSTIGVLADLGITEVRMRDALLRSSAAADMFAGAMEKGNEEFEANNALTAEAAKRYETVESKIAIAGNAIKDAAISYGETLLPLVSAGADAVAGLASFLGDLPEPARIALTAMGGLAGVVALIGGAAMLAVPQLARFKTALEILHTSVGKVALIGGGVTLAISAIIGIVSALAGAHAEAEARAQSYADTLKNGAQSTADTYSMVADKMLEDQDGWDFVFSDRWLSGADAAEKLGMNVSEVSKIVADGGPKFADLSKRVEDLQNNTNGAADALANELGVSTREVQDAAYNLLPVLKTEGELVQKGKDDAAAKADAMKGLADETDGAAVAAQSAAEEFLAEGAAAEELTSQIDKLLNKLFETNDLNRDAITSSNNYKEAMWEVNEVVRKATEGIDENGDGVADHTLTLDTNTQAGVDNMNMLIDLSKKAEDAAAAQFALDGDTQNLTASLTDAHTNIVNAATAMGYTAEEAVNLANKILGIPDQKTIDIVANTVSARDSLNNFINTLNSIPNYKGVTVETIVGNPSMGYVPSSYAGNIFTGGKMEAFARGGFPSGIYDGVNGGIHKFAEREKGVKWEAYISGRAADRDRNVGIAFESLRRMGVTAPSAPPVSLDGMAITGRLDIGGDGLARIIDGRIVSAMPSAGQVASRFGGR